MTNNLDTELSNAIIHWLPVKFIEIKDEKPLIEWLYLDDHKIAEPFFEETILKVKSHPYNSNKYKVRTDIDLLIDWANSIPSVDLLSMIFHVSRCGSTMISQLLVIPEENIVISEAPILDQILRSDTLSNDYKTILFKAVIKFLGYKRFEHQTQLIIKLDAWHLLYIHQIRTLFPQTPFFILYRNPEDVLKSHARNRGMHMIPNLLPQEMFGFDNSTTWENLTDYSNNVLQKYYEAILSFSHKDKLVFLSCYENGMIQVVTDFMQSSNIIYNENIMVFMKNRLLRHSKKSNQVFKGDAPITIDINLEKSNALFDLINQIKLKK